MRRTPHPVFLVLIAGLLPAVGPARGAETAPLVLAVDAALDADARAYAGATVAWLVGALPADAEIGLIVYDDVVRNAVPLALAGGGQLDLIDEALTTPTRDSVESNVAVGLERGLDELDGREGAQLVLFADARFSGEDDVARARFADWSREILLPDAAAAGITITLVAPESGADATLLEELARYPANAIRVLGAAPPADLVQELIERLMRDDPDVVAVAPDVDAGREGSLDPDAAAVPEAPAVTVVGGAVDGDVSDASPEPTAGVAPDAGLAGTPVVRPGAPAGSPAEIVVADATVPAGGPSAPLDGSGETATIASESTTSTETPIGDASLGRWPWLIGIGALLVGTPSLLLAWRRRRSSGSTATTARGRTPVPAEAAATTAPRGHRPPRGTADDMRGRSPATGRRGGPGRSSAADRTLDRTRDRVRKKAATARRAPPKHARQVDDDAATAARTAQRTSPTSADPTLERGAGQAAGAVAASATVASADATARRDGVSGGAGTTARHDDRPSGTDASARRDDVPDGTEATTRHDDGPDGTDETARQGGLDTSARHPRDDLPDAEHAVPAVTVDQPTDVTAERPPEAERTARRGPGEDDVPEREPDADATARRDDTDPASATDGAGTGDDPDATARHGSPKEAVDDLELLAELTAERQRRDSLD